MAYDSSRSSSSNNAVTTCSKSCLKNYATLKKHYDDVRTELNKSECHLADYKRGLASVEEQLVHYQTNESLLNEIIVVLKRDISHRDSEIVVLKKGGGEVESTSEIERKTVAYSMDKVEVDIPKQNVKPARRPVKYAEMYITQRPKGNQRNWNNLKSHQLEGKDGKWD
nr:hypothetical protein [Tanacetum cinerariifolium]